MGLLRNLGNVLVLCGLLMPACSLGEEGGSEPAQCKRDETRCDGNWLQQCRQEVWEDLEQCTNGCEKGACLDPPQGCESGQRRCKGDAVELCEGEPGEWMPLKECAEGCESGECLDRVGGVCTAGERTCDQNQVWQCADDGWDWSLLQECEVTCEEGACVGSATVHVRGTISYEARFPDANGEEIVIGAITTVPLGFVIVLVTDGEQILGQAVSQASGAFDVGLAQPLKGGESLLFVPALEVGEKVVLVVAKPTQGGTPGSSDADPWVWNLPLEGKTELGDLTILESSGSGAAYIYDFNRSAFGSVLGSNLLPQTDRIKPLSILWAPGVAWNCGACYAPYPQEFGDQSLPNSIFISDDPGGSSAWGYAVLLHEFGHYVARNYSRDDSPGGPHTIGVPVVPPFAWSEGWATFFALSTFSRFAGEPMPLYWDIQGGGSFWINLANLQHSSTFTITQPDSQGSMLQSLDENWVAMMLWDLWDGADIPEVVEEDGTALGTSAVIRAITSPRFLNGDRGAQGADFVDFLDSVLCDQPGLASNLEQTVNTYLGFPYDGAWVCN